MTAPCYAVFVTNPKKAAQELDEARIEAWYPTFLRLKAINRRGGRDLRPEPMFPGYVFARIPRGGFAQVCACEHVAYVVGVAGVPYPVPEAIYAGLVDLATSGRMDERAPATKARPRGVRARGLESLAAWFELIGQRTKAAA